MATLLRKSGRVSPEKAILFVCDIQSVLCPLIHNGGTVIQNSAFIYKISRLLGIPSIVTEQYPKGLGHTVRQLELEANEIVFEKKSFSMLTNQVKDNLRRKTFGETEISLPQMKADKQNIVLPLAAGESTTADHLANNSEAGFRNQIILCGIESHVCVLQTVFDLLAIELNNNNGNINSSNQEGKSRQEPLQGYEIHIILDAISSQSYYHITSALLLVFTGSPYDRDIAIHRMISLGCIPTTTESLIFQMLQSADHPQFKAISNLIRDHKGYVNEFAV